MHLLPLILVGASLGADIGVFHDVSAPSTTSATQAVQPEVIDFAAYDGASEHVVSQHKIQQVSGCKTSCATTSSCAATTIDCTPMSVCDSSSDCNPISCGQSVCGPITHGCRPLCDSVCGSTPPACEAYAYGNACGCGNGYGCNNGCSHGCGPVCTCNGSGVCDACNGSAGWQYGYGYASDDCDNGCCWLDECWNDHLMRNCVGPGDLYPHYAYYPKFHGYYYFRPYNYIHVERDAAIAASMGGDVRAPYSTEFLKPLFESYAATAPIPEQPEKRPFEAKVPDLEDLVRGSSAPAAAPSKREMPPTYEPPAPAPGNPLDGPGI